MFRAIDYIVNPTTRELVHTPTCACLRYTDDGKLKVLLSAAARPEDMPALLQGAKQALQQQYGCDPRMGFIWGAA
jgi:hypothetical protein